MASRQKLPKERTLADEAIRQPRVKKYQADVADIRKREVEGKITRAEGGIEKNALWKVFEQWEKDNNLWIEIPKSEIIAGKLQEIDYLKAELKELGVTVNIVQVGV